MDRLEQLYKDLQPKLYAYFYIKTSNPSVAEDLTQDVFYEASKKIHLYRGEATLSTWLYSIANNLLKKYYRSKKYDAALLERIEGPTIIPVTTEDIVEIKQEVATLWQHIQTFDEQAKEIVLLRLYGELSFKDIADLIGKSENYVRVTFHRLKLKLKEMGGSAT